MLGEQLRASGGPPYRDAYGYATQLQYYDALDPYPRTAYFTSHEPSGIDGNGAAEYGPLDKVNKLKGLFDMFAVMYPQLQGIDFRRDVPRLEVPVYLVQGAHELSARGDLAADWFAHLQAPGKHWVTFPASGHIPQFEEFARFHDYVVRHGAARDTVTPSPACSPAGEAAGGTCADGPVRGRSGAWHGS